MELTDTPHSDAAPHAHYTPPLFSGTNDTLRHVIHPTVQVTLPWSVPVALTENGSFLSDVCGLSPVSEYPALHILAAMGAEAAKRPLPAGLAGPAAWDQASTLTRALDIGQLPWPAIIPAVFSAAAEKFLSPQERTPHFSRTMLELILERSGTLTEQDFAAKLADFGTKPPAKKILYMHGLTTDALVKIARPGAWLLDYIHTAVGVLLGGFKPSVIYTAVLNQTHLELLEVCFPDAAISAPGCSLNNRGNQMEGMCWLHVEADHPEMALAQAYHSYRRARTAQLAEAGATDPDDVPHQSADTMQALISFGHQLGFFFPTADHLQSQADRVGPGPRSTPPGPPPGAFAPSSHTLSDPLRQRLAGPSHSHSG